MTVLDLSSPRNAIAQADEALAHGSSDLAIAHYVLAAHASADTVVRVFGSRARGVARRGSDLDLAIDAGRLLTSRESGALADAFEELDLPYTVDLVDVRAASEGFLALIENEWKPLPHS